MFWEGSKLLVTENKRTAPSLLSPGSVFGRLTATYEMKTKIANDVRALRTPQALPVTDGEEVSA